LLAELRIVEVLDWITELRMADFDWKRLLALGTKVDVHPNHFLVGILAKSTGKGAVPLKKMIDQGKVRPKILPTKTRECCSSWHILNIRRLRVGDLRTHSSIEGLLLCVLLIHSRSCTFQLVSVNVGRPEDVLATIALDQLHSQKEIRGRVEGVREDVCPKRWPQAVLHRLL
jgi:hypothetical protein